MYFKMRKTFGPRPRKYATPRFPALDHSLPCWSVFLGAIERPEKSVRGRCM